MRIAEYFAGKNLLITGASGLVGKALVEKVLRSCPDVGTIYLIIRSKRGCPPEKRWQHIIDRERSIFSKLIKTRPEVLSKIVIMEGANELDNYGLTPENLKILEDNVHMIFHSAATINFVEPMVSAVLVNIKATYTLCEIARRMKKFECFIHVSTAFSQAYRCKVKEQVYPAAYDWRGLITLAENPENESILAVLSPLIVGEQTISYTFTKALAENVVDDYSKYFPVATMRIALVMGTMLEPEPGWTDVLNFLEAICVGVRAGVVRTALCEMDDRSPQIPLDHSVKALLAAAWKTHESGKKTGNEVYCCRQADYLDFNFLDVREIGLNYASRWPWDQSLWYPFILMTNSPFMYKLYFRIFHVIPGFFLDLLAKCVGQPPRLFKVYARMWKLTNLFTHAVGREINFYRENYVSLNSSLLPDDRKDFLIDEENCLDKQTYFDTCSRTALFFFGGERLGDTPIPASLRRLKIQRIIHVLTFLTFGFIGGWLTNSLFGIEDPSIRMSLYAIFVGSSAAAVWSTMRV